MVEKGLRGFLERLDENGQLVRYRDRVLPEPDIRNIGRGCADLGASGPAVLIENIAGYRDRSVCMGAQGSWANHALMLGMDKSASVRSQFDEYARRWSSRRSGKLTWVENPACRDFVLREGINLYELIPAFRVNKYDGGMYLSKAAIVTRDPDEPERLDTENVGIYRVQLQGPDTLGIQIMPFHDAAIHVRKAEERGQALPIAICLGVDPFISLMAAAPLEYDESEYEFAAGIAGREIELAKALTSNLDIDANAEYVIEGEIEPRARYPEGPFGEFPGSYSGCRKQYRVKVKAVTHRRSPIFENLYVGRPWTEHDTLIGLTTSVPIYFQLKETMPEVSAVNAIYQHGLSIIVSTGSRFGGYAKSVAFRVASTPHGISYAKNIILVDEDIDPFDMNQVMWALSTRVRPEKDVIVIPNVPGMPLDPCSDPPGMGAKLIIDATTPVAPEIVQRETRIVERIPDAARFAQTLRELWKGGEGR